ncbi:MAG: ATP synthase F1 subunit gamma [Clostridiaceae bacterium]|nr:ATP synthase F1 subunit gamma [Clostridiaceae bacterium]
MANTREIQTRMKSIQDTMKITNAMYMISSSKMKKARKSLSDAEPYFYTLQMAIERILRHLPDVMNQYFEPEEPAGKKKEKKVGYLVVTADKGLAGAYNHNVIKLAQEALDGPGSHMLFIVGDIGRQYFVKKGFEIEQDFQYTVQNPTMSRARNIAESLLRYYNSHNLDEVHIIYTKMVNAMQTEAETLQLLPLKKTSFGSRFVDVPMEEIALWPSADAVLQNIVPNYIAGFIYGALVESYCSEQNSRMMAMEAATTSAKDMLKELSVAYNRARQAAITQELTEVISGAKAQKKKKKY